MTTIAVIAEDEDDALAWAVHNSRRFPGADIQLMWWPDRMKRVLLETQGFDRLIATTTASRDPRIEAWKAAALTKLRDANGLTVSQRLALENPR